MKKPTLIAIGVLHMVVIAVALSIGTVHEWDAVISIIGIAASALSLAMGAFMWRLNHALARCFVTETIADVFAAGCTTVFAVHTYYGHAIDVRFQIILRLLILGSAVTAQIHLFRTVRRIIEDEET